jgi:hypothetical protein
LKNTVNTVLTNGFIFLHQNPFLLLVNSKNFTANNQAQRFNKKAGISVYKRSFRRI